MSDENLRGELGGAIDPLARLSPAQRRLLEFRLRKSGVTTPFLPRIPRRPNPGLVELSFAQERFWFLEQLEEGISLYNRAQALRLVGPVEASVTQRSFDALLARHEILRMAIPASDGKPAPFIEPRLSIELPFSDLTGLPEELREAEARRLIRKEADRPFDLAQAPLLRVRLIQLSENDHVLVMVIHHIVSDFWSDGVFWREFEAFYKSLLSGSPCNLPELPVQYPDFAAWQRQWLQGEALEKQLSFWKQQLGANTQLLKLPADHRKNPNPAMGYAGETLLLDKSLVDALKTLSQQQDATLFMTLLAAYVSLLNRYSHQEDILVGTTMAGRDRAELEGLIGVFVKTLVMRNDISGDPPFLELLRRVRTVALSAYVHQELPFEKLVDELRPARNLNRTPFFQAFFNFRNLPTSIPHLTGVEAQTFEIVYGAPQFQVELEISERKEGLFCLFRCDPNLFDGSTAARMLNQYECLLEGVVQNPGCPLSELQLMSDWERDRLLHDWSTNLRHDCTPVECVHKLIEKQAQWLPTAFAVELEGRLLTYGQLNACSNRLARELNQLGVGPEVVVGICMERSIELIVSLLGVLKAGGAYLPLDPDNPPERLNFILRDARPVVILTQARYQQELAGLPSMIRPEPDSRLIPFPTAPPALVCLDQGLLDTLPGSELSPESGSGIENLAYVIYTSGSTGQPKGVMISHRALGSYVRSARGTYEISPQDRVLQFASISFDASVEEIFCCLAAGGTLVLRTESMLASPAEFLQKCQQWRITVLSLPTAYWHELAAHLEIGPLPFPSCLRLLIIGGERAIPDRLVTWRERGPAWVRLVNTYGPTEATVVATSWEADSLVEDVRSMGEVPIGRPLPHVQAYVLDRHLQPVPIGMPGELFLGGEGISKGYLNRAELTAEKFLPSLFGQLPTERLYRTGDVVRYRPDGNLEYLGRLDQQVKLRGYRIELGEIEAVLTDHPEVRSAAARMWEDSSEERQIVAYVVADRKTPPPSQELRRFLRNRLPDFMVPSKLIFLDALPLTSSGKIDRLALPAPSLKEKEKRDHPVQAPRTPFEEMVACVWAEVLKVPQIGVEENFFELGGHSLLAIQVISRLGKAFSLNLPLRLLFESPTVAELATAIVERLVASRGEEEIAQVLQQGEQAEQE